LETNGKSMGAQLRLQLFHWSIAIDPLADRDVRQLREVSPSTIALLENPLWKMLHGWLVGWRLWPNVTELDGNARL
jgi:hypothetical protein